MNYVKHSISSGLLFMKAIFVCGKYQYSSQKHPKEAFMAYIINLNN